MNTILIYNISKGGVEKPLPDRWNQVFHPLNRTHQLSDRALADADWILLLVDDPESQPLHSRPGDNRRMPRVSIQDFPLHTIVIFIDRQRQAKIGPTRRYTSTEPVFEMLRRAHANLETLNIVEMAFRERRPCMVDLNLTDEQYAAIQTVKQCRDPLQSTC
jgi:hypothetical protein